MADESHRYILAETTIPTLRYGSILKHSTAIVDTGQKGFFDMHPDAIEINHASFSLPSPGGPLSLFISQADNAVILSCGCNTPKHKLCSHQVQLLMNITERNYLRVFFDKALRYKHMRTAAEEYGLEHEPDLDDFFEIIFTHKAFEIRPKIKGLLPVGEPANQYLATHLLPAPLLPPPPINPASQTIAVLGRHKYLGHFFIELMEAPTAKDGAIKNPLATLNPMEKLWEAKDADEAKFYSAVARFQNNYEAANPPQDIAALKALVKNPAGLSFFVQDAAAEKITAGSLLAIQVKNLPLDIDLAIHRKESFYEIKGELVLDGKTYPLKDLPLQYGYFIKLANTLYLITDAGFLKVMDFFKRHNHLVLIHHTKFETFKNDILSKLENKVRIKYSYVEPATPEQLEEQHFDTGREQIIYLSDGEQYVFITPVIKYGNVEIPVLSRRQIYATDNNGNTFLVTRDDDAEVRLTADILKQHASFYEQLESTDSFYLHKKYFLDEAWFLDAFENWQNKGITVLGFNTFKNNPLNPHRAKVSVSVTTGINWFETLVEVRFGKQQASLKHLQKALRNKSRFVKLGDGSQGILPTDWIEKFTAYFQSGEVVGETIRTPKSNFSAIQQWYDERQLAPSVRQEIAYYQQQLENFETIAEIPVPQDLQATLRPYQRQGLNWLNFLDQFGFGGCLADDMGLGKTIQVTAFLLSQRNKPWRNTNLVVVPASLVFNWQDALQEFAPSIKLLTLYGAGRVKSVKEFDGYEIVLTTYGMLLSDIGHLKNYTFNYVVLDESQAIKNPESQRYKAACLLQSRNRLVLTGTPVENHTFDLYGQLSFACPGLLGSKQFFKDIYSNPIDKFDNSKRAADLQKKISPFILRRTKRQVAQELPDKTEMLIYCEMGDAQRKVYETAEEEIREYLRPKPAYQEDSIKDPMYVLKSLMRLRQICNSPALLKDEEFYGRQSSKIEVLMEQLENKSPDHKILVFSQFVGMLDLIKKQLVAKNIGFAYLTGQTKDRAAQVGSFQNNPEIRVFLISLKAGGTGLNLTEADYVYLVDPWWNPAVENQAIDRSHRIGQDKKVVAIRLICPDTVEEKIMRLQQSKKELASGLVKTDTEVMKAFSRQELLDLLRTGR